jgi:hypothetical protein
VRTHAGSTPRYLNAIAAEAAKIEISGARVAPERSGGAVSAILPPPPLGIDIA